MPSGIFFVSKNNSLLRYHDPFSVGSLKLGDDEPLFAFRLHEAGCERLSRDWTYPKVLSPFWRLYWNEASGAWIECHGRRFSLGPGHLVLVPSHTLFDTEGAKHLVSHFWIHFSLYPDLASASNSPILVPCGKELLSLVSKLAERVRQKNSQPMRSLYHLSNALLHQAFAMSEVYAQQYQLPSKLHGLLKEMENSLGSQLSISDVARKVGMSRGGFIRWFRQHMGSTPARYLQARRIDHACRMLKFSSASIEEISELIGFANRSHFSRVFQAQMGIGPASFRRNGPKG
jgi:AraC-like DNA-binding protein